MYVANIQTHCSTPSSPASPTKNRIRDLQQTHAHLKYISFEPLLGPIGRIPLRCIDWAIVGGESGHGARPMNPEWVISIRNQCQRAYVPFFFKQWGGVNKKKAGRLLEGKIYDEMPESFGKCGR